MYNLIPSKSLDDFLFKLAEDNPKKVFINHYDKSNLTSQIQLSYISGLNIVQFQEEQFLENEVEKVFQNIDKSKLNQGSIQVIDFKDPSQFQVSIYSAFLCELPDFRASSNFGIYPVCIYGSSSKEVDSQEIYSSFLRDTKLTVNGFIDYSGYEERSLLFDLDSQEYKGNEKTIALFDLDSDITYVLPITSSMKDVNGIIIDITSGNTTGSENSCETITNMFSGRDEYVFRDFVPFKEVFKLAEETQYHQIGL